MEGKALLFKYLGGVDAVPICLATKDPEEIIKTVKYLRSHPLAVSIWKISRTPSVSRYLPACRPKWKYRSGMMIKQGTATIVTAGAINAHKVVGKKLKDSKVAMVGAGAANIAISRVMIRCRVQYQEHRDVRQ